jgi:lambda family phage portal protein
MATDLSGDLGRWIDSLIEPFSPALARRRLAERLALTTVRQYDAADSGRRTNGWRRPATSADREIRVALVRLRNGARELVRNNPVASATVKQIVANMVGDGITITAKHADPVIAQKAQAAWDGWAESKVDGVQDFYGVQKMTARSVIEGGDTLLSWGPDADGPDGFIRGLEGDFLDHLRMDERLGAGRTVQGVRFDANGVPDAFWLYDRHPGDYGGYGQSRLHPAADIDHVFERLRWGQTRGVSWFAPVALAMRDIGDYEDAIRMKRKVEACLALVLTPQDGNPGSPLAAQETNPDDPKRPAIETLRPGMIFRTRPGETVSTMNPSSAGGESEFLRQSLMQVSAGLAPYHMISGDALGTNYTTLRAVQLAFWSNLDDWQQNMMIPQACAPAFMRRMRRLALETGERRFLQVTADYAVPARRLLDPAKDLLGEEIEVRAGFKTMKKALSERGVNWRDQLDDIAEFNQYADGKEVILDTDPRKITDLGVLQLGAAAQTAGTADQTSNKG